MAQKLSFACVEMILRYHLSPQQIFFTHNWACHDTAVWFLVFVFVFCVGCFCLCVFVLCLVLFFFVFGFSASSGT